MKGGLIFLLLTCLAIPFLQAEHYALLIPLRGGAAELEQEIQANCQELERLLTSEKVRVSKKSGANEITDFLRDFSEKSTESDELSIYLFGHVSAGAKHVTLATQEGRLNGTVFAETVLHSNAKKTVYLFCTRSASLFDLFASGNTRVVSAADDPGQLNPPRYGTFFITAKKELGPGASLEQLAKRAGELTTAFYQSNQLAVSENSQLFLDGKRNSFPFDGMKTASFNIDESKNSGFQASELRKFLSKKVKLQSCSEAQKKQLSEARTVAKSYSNYPYVAIRRNLKLTLNPDQSALVELSETYYLNQARAFLNSAAQVSAQILFPDNTFAEFQTSANELPLIPGSLIILQTLHPLPSPSHLPEFHFEWFLSLPVPVLETEISIHPGHAAKVNSSVLPKQTVKTVSLKNGFKPGFLPAFSPLPNESVQPMRWVATTLQSWDDFYRWATRMSDRALELSPESKQFLERLVKDAPTQSAKVKAVYDYLNSLRYSTIPIGAAAFRPQKIDQLIFNAYGDCKDKATALAAFCNELGIPAWRVLLKRNGTIDPDFPAWQFNHMLVYIPNLEGFPEGLWLDPTDGATEFGDLPPEDADSLGFILKENSFAFKKVALSGKIKNSVFTEIELAEEKTEKNILAKISTKRTGFAQYLHTQEQKRLFPEQQQYAAEKELARLLPGFSLDSFGPDTITASGPMGSFVPGLNLLTVDVESLFAMKEYTHPLRLFDGRPITFTTRLHWKNKPFPAFVFERSCDDFTLGVKAQGDTLVLSVEFLNSNLSPESYKKIRGILFEARTEFLNKGLNHGRN